MCSCVFQFNPLDDSVHARSSIDMPRKSTTNPVSEESRVSGELLGLPLVSSVTSIRSQRASRITWHQHGCYELLLLLDGSTAYEFSDGRTVELPGGHFMVIQPEMVHRGFHDVRRPVRLTSPGSCLIRTPKGHTRILPFLHKNLIGYTSSLTLERCSRGIWDLSFGVR